MAHYLQENSTWIFSKHLSHTLPPMLPFPCPYSRLQHKLGPGCWVRNPSMPKPSPHIHTHPVFYTSLLLPSPMQPPWFKSPYQLSVSAYNSLLNVLPASRFLSVNQDNNLTTLLSWLKNSEDSLESTGWSLNSFAFYSDRSTFTTFLHWPYTHTLRPRHNTVLFPSTNSLPRVSASAETVPSDMLPTHCPFWSLPRETFKDLPNQNWPPPILCLLHLYIEMVDLFVHLPH